MSNFSLAEQIGAAVDGVSAIAQGPRTVETVTAEILELKAQTGDKLIAIGERLAEAKAMLPHGEWLPWLENSVEFSERTAQELMKIAREFPNPRALADLGKRKILKLLLLPPAEREKFVEAHDVQKMSTRELDEAIKKQRELKDELEKVRAAAIRENARADEEEKRANDLSEDVETLGDKLAEAEQRIKELESAPKELYRDEEAIKIAAAEARNAAAAEWADKLKAAEAKLAKTEDKAKKAAEKAKSAGANASAESAAELEAAKAEAERLRGELDAAKQEAEHAAKAAAIAGDADISEFKLYFRLAQENINRMRGLLLKVRVREDQTAGEKLAAAMSALADAVKEAAK